MTYSGTSLGELAALSAADCIDSLCDRFEAQWQSGAAPRVEDFVAMAPAAVQRELLLELIAVDCDQRRKRGEAPDLAEYASRFPEHALTLSQAHGSTRRPAESQQGTGQQRVGRFELLAEIGRGAFGTVWQARDPLLDRLVALKLPRTIDLNPDDTLRAEREAKAAANLKHPHIVTVHESGRDGERPYLVSEFIDGVSLKTLLAERRPSIPESVSWCRKLAEALESAHNNHVVHRDLKPGNILIDRNNEPYITDFGLAKRVYLDHSQTIEGQILGTPAYMSPEQAAGAAHAVDGRSDVYSLGVVLYELLTGKPPFRGAIVDVLPRIRSEPPVPPCALNPDVVPALESICLKALAKQPEDRYRSARELALDLANFELGLPISVWPPSPQPGWKTRYWAAWEPRISRALLAALLGIAAVLCFLPNADHAPLPRVRNPLALTMYDSVGLVTEPPGASVAFVPLSLRSGEPLWAKAGRAPGVSPVRTRLKPGWHLVVAQWPDGVFHEVYRLIPGEKRDLTTLNTASQHNWEVDGNMTFQMKKIRKPDPLVTQEMVRLEGIRDSRELTGPNMSLPREDHRIAPFFIDRHEVTIKEWLGHWQNTPGRTSHANLDPLEPIHGITLHQALEFAERCGKRLPTAWELACAATNGGTTQYPWGEYVRETEFWPIAVPVGSAQHDHLKSNPEVVGLYSNVGEWTTTPSEPGPRPDPGPDALLLPEYRVIWGIPRSALEGGFDFGNLSNTSPGFDVSAEAHSTWRMLGMRCVRSERPPIVIEDISELPSVEDVAAQVAGK